VSASLALAVLAVAACSSSSSTASSGASPSPAAAAQATTSGQAPSPDPRVGLRAGWTDAGEASWNMRLIANRASPPGADEAWNSDLAFLRNYVFQGNFNGFVVWDASNPANPTLVKPYLCPASQSDVSVYGNLLFVSSESTSGRIDCGTEAPQEPVSAVRLRGIRIFDISDIRNPRYIHNVQTCRGSHTHSLVTDPNDPTNVYIYVSGSSFVRPSEELPGCSDLSPDEDPNSSLFRIEVIQIPVAAPQNARIVTAARVFAGMEAAPRRAGGGGGGGRAGGGGRRGGRGGGGGAESREGPNQCHDITTYPAVGLAGGACQGYGILIDIRNPAQPQRLSAVADTNFATWHSVTFNNDGSKVLWTDEWGGGTQPRCRATDNPVWGGNAIFSINGQRAEFLSYYKMRAPQTETENCVAHNGSLIPVPGRDIKVQGWYQGGISVFDWTDGRNPFEIAFFDRGPLVADTLRVGGSWSAYWYNGYIYSSEIERGLDVLEMLPNPLLTQNELDAAKTVRQEYFNAQEQQRFVWPPSFALARAYVDQLERARGLTNDRITAVRAELARVERLSGQARNDALRQLAGQLDGDAQRSSDAAKARLLAAAVRDLAGM
jgi:hypothetical protein